MTLSTTADDAGRYTGARVLRAEDPKYLMGRGTYVDDIVLPGMLHAAFVRSPHAHARVLRVDLDVARRLDGVVAAFSGADLMDHVGELITPPNRAETQPLGQRALAPDRVRYVGEAVAVVVAASRYLAEDACQLVEVEWEPLPVVLDAEAAMAPGAPSLHPSLEHNNLAHITLEGGSVEATFAAAPRVFSKRFHVHRYAAMPLETRGVVADYNPGTGRVVVWLSNQFPHSTRAALAGALGMPARNVQVIAPDVGGGFGAKVAVFMEDLVIPAVSRLIGRPVKWIEDRYEHLATTGHSKEMTCDVAIAVDDDGTFLAFRGHFIGNGGAYSSFPFTTTVDSYSAAGMLVNQYGARHARSIADGPTTNKAPVTAYRGVGWTSGHTAREVLIDDIARALAIDPVDLRLRNTIAQEPYDAPFGQRYDGGSFRDALLLACERIDYSGFRERQARLRDEQRFIGIGFSPYVEPSGFSNAISKANGWTASYFDTAQVTLEPDGSVTVTTGIVSQGQGHATTFAQVAADVLGVRVEDVRVVQGDSDTTAFGMGTFASRGAVVAAGTIRAAAGEVRKKLVALASNALEAAPDDVVLSRGQAFVQGSPARSVSIAELAVSVYWLGARAPEGVEDLTLSATRSYEPGETYSNGTVAVVVEVDVETGEIDVQQIVAVEDCGTMLNPMIVDGQVAGAVAQGIGGALYEEITYGDDGQLLSSTLMDYLYPSTTEVPDMDIQHIETPSPVTAGGVKGMGEAGSIATPAAIINAVADALAPFGVEIDRSPLTPDRILALLRVRRQQTV
jgi:carbon-monoxide dehydrogenase large subunit